ncbi:MmgE/PrpD family protein [Paracoccus aerius]|uniref:MmgE/PrpD family protein n=1 Tax=Paracoccus aerius TaxID=1915382 RepID=A0ABS1S553_9RHOB|nr:MmgE/PrpD family protein [Paracoccus aerius]MBL3673834.1 MmgE/PrpD family protein [Paracoccus aerius]GHG32430.1 2-methylcitrate dehydratase [Paracoccus aerius]
MTDAARILSLAAARSDFGALPQQEQAVWRDFILDTLAVMAAGAAHPSVSVARSALVAAGGVGPASVMGFAQGASAGTAALANGMAMTVLQLQDGHRRARGHPMSHVLPAALAVAEETGATTGEFLNAVVAGYEVSARIGAALGGMQPLLHDTGTFGCIGAAVAAAFILGRGLEHPARAQLVEAAIGNAAAVALFPFRDTCIEGAGVHHLFVGLGAQNGITAARAALAGLSPSPATLERFFGPRAGEGFDPALLTQGIGPDGCWSRSEILSAYLKWHPVCAHLGSMLDCIEALRDRPEGMDPDRIAAVTIEVYSTALQYDSPDPRTDLAARFSFRHAAALSLCLGPLRHDGFSPDRLARPEVQAMAARVRLVTDPRLDALYPENRPARVTLDLTDGSQAQAEVRAPKGDSARPLTRAEVQAKAAVLMQAAWGDDDPFHRIVALLDRPPPDLPQQLGRVLGRGFAP